MTQNGKEEEKSINIADNISGVEYSNLVVVNHNQEEFQLNFLTVAGESGRVVAKIIMTPGHMVRLLNTIKENIEKYRERFGQQEPQQESAAETIKEKIADNIGKDVLKQNFSK